MALNDRDYSRGSGGGWRDGGFGSSGPAASAGDAFRRAFAFLNLSFPIGRVFGIRIRVHILFVLLVLFNVWPRARVNAPALDQMLWNLRWMGLLFGSVLLHEFGHCFGCRAVGGQAEDILMWPLGGLASCDPPRRPWPEFVTIACGPLVNVVIAGASYFALLMWLGADRIPVSLNPFEMWRMNVYWFFSDALGVRLLADLFVVNYALLLFNLTMLFYPFDGGRIVQVILWVWMGYERSMRLATTLGMIGAVIAAGVGLWQGSVMLVVIAAFGFLACVQQRRYLKQAAAYEPDSDPRFAAAYETAGGERGAWFGADGNEDRGARHASRRPGMISRWRTARAEKRVDGERRRAVADDAEVNRILDKVREQGLASLSQREKDALQRATEKQRGR